ncbi:hypothetical protein PIB30_035559 [Stylosanthes scabra]|uniref:Uncharacterized protein n=1 Tax=Stylosanthes scabra TaxID=79078 RepID=A0ABU6TCW4_9FABA|nr:hypothetical protein [Stylosanthes scabra]
MVPEPRSRNLSLRRGNELKNWKRKLKLTTFSNVLDQEGSRIYATVGEKKKKPKEHENMELKAELDA